jgi:hypothetical protein
MEQIQRGTAMPENAGYYHLAYAVATGIYVIYAVTLVIRWKRVRPK